MAEARHDPDSSKWPTADATGGLFHGMKVHTEYPKPEVTFTQEELESKLTPEQFLVTQERGTERRWTGKYLKMNDDGVFPCVVCGISLFKTDMKFDSGCGWLSFSDVVSTDHVALVRDTTLRERTRIEIVCSKCGAHLGHVFEDGPKQSTGLRYCINSLSLGFEKQADGN
ncbi:hypothetical protein EMCRGX_G025716 [Ephydatia muelleri]|eukprot:Em0021g497a